MSHLVVLLLLATVVRISAITYQVVNNAANTSGGARFDSEIGSSYAEQTLSSATDFIWGILQETDPSTQKTNIDNVFLFIENMGGAEIAYTRSNEIHIRASHIGGYSDDVKNEVTGILYHEMTHVWQWDGNGQTPAGLKEGVADFVRLKAGYNPNNWVEPGEGDRWDQGYDVTARFLDYCEGLILPTRGNGISFSWFVPQKNNKEKKNSSGFVAQLNGKMRNGYNVGFFNDLLGKSVDELWADYMAKYGN